MSLSASVAPLAREPALLRLDDRFTLRSGTIFINGVQALVRMMLVQADRDATAGLKTGGYVSGYRGSPLGTLDTAFGTARALTDARRIVVQPAVNEELGATAVAGSQQIARTPARNVDGVFALWYGKGPGLDRAADAIRHGNVQGSSPHGGVVLAVGDDHLAKSSSITCCSDEAVAALQIPLFYPADAAEIVEYGLHGFALSRHTGSWAALKIVTDVADSTRTVSAESGPMPVLPPIAPPPMGLHNHWPETPQEQEVRLVEHRLPAIAAYVRANRLDRIVLKRPGAMLGLVAAGKSWLDLREAFRLLGLDDARLETLGIALYKPALIWPMEPEGLREFAAGLDALIIVEEKGGFVERQAKEILYDAPKPPAIWGKTGPQGEALLPAILDLTPERIAASVGAVIAARTGDADVTAAAEALGRSLVARTLLATPPAVRKPFFCSGCPHNRSTVLPEGSRALAGIGCHGLAAYNRPATGSFAQMGGEGVHWMGLSPFTDEPHLFANMGDGTYFHSGALAIRQAVAAKINITYKLLFNSAVAMTGGQQIDGELTVDGLVDQLRSEGVRRIVITTDDPDRYAASDPVRARVSRIAHRDDIDEVQRELREVPGVSVIIHDQMCATEKRRLRKRGKLADPTTRVFINEAVCEGCGDCSAKSNCLSVEPVDTPLGTKRRINQSSCNKDYSCLNGFCPSFVTVEGAKPRKAKHAGGNVELGTLPPRPEAPWRHQRILVGGVGGTGVVTIGALVTTASHIAGRVTGVLDQVGMAQKGGAVISHIHLADERIDALHICAGEADLVLACDQIVGNLPDIMAAIAPGRTHVIVNADVSITGDFTQDRNARPDATLLARRLRQRAGDDHVVAHPFTRLAERLFGDAIGSNLMMLGLAWQKGWISLDPAAFDAAIDLNGAAVAMNKDAFAWGRRLALDPAAVYAAAGLADPPAETFTAMTARHALFLTAYQDEAYAARYRATIARVADADERAGGDGALTANAARTLFKLMAYKDEYEVARLYSDSAFDAALGEAFEGKAKLSFHLAPPLFARRDKITGHLRKHRFGAWVLPVFRMLARGKRLRGTRLDPFGYTAERRAERAMIGAYEQLLTHLTTRLGVHNLAEATHIAALAQDVRGFGHVKEAAMTQYAATLDAALGAFDQLSPEAEAASRAALGGIGV